MTFHPEPQPIIPATPFPGTASPDVALLALIQRVSSAGRALRRMLAEHAAAVGLTDAELLVVWLSARGMVQGDLATAVGVSPALMSGTVERLRQQGLIEMHRSPVDRRRQVWRTTQRGQELFDGLRPALLLAAGQIASRFSAAELGAVRELCDRLSGAAQEIAASLPIRLATNQREAA